MGKKRGAMAASRMARASARDVSGVGKVATPARRVARAFGQSAVGQQRGDARRALSLRKGRGNALILSAAAPEAPEASAEAESRSTLRIKLKCYSSEPLQEAVDAILDVAYRTGCDKTGPAYLPTRRRKYTILKSPHVNKDSREQFEIRTHQRLIDLKNVSAQTIDGLMALDLPAGVDVEVKL